MKNILHPLLVSFSITFAYNLQSQCLQIPVSLPEICQGSSFIARGRLELLKTFRHTDNNIYTLYMLDVSDIYKGSVQDSVYIVSLGGQMGLQRTVATPSDELQTGDGFFFLESATAICPGLMPNMQYRLAGGSQGRVWINGSYIEDIYNRYKDYNVLVNDIVGITHTSNKIKDLLPSGIRENTKRATPTISSFTPTYRSAGSDSTIVITGTNFNSPRSTGFVEFRNADDGGTTYIKPLATDYVSWSNTQIEVRVPSGAGTGDIRVTNSDPASVTSAGTLTIPYNILNVVYNPGSGNTHYRSRLQGLNSGAMTFFFNTRFNDSIKAKQDFLTILSKWRCASGVNFDTTGTRTSTNVPTYDNENDVMWDFNSTLTMGILGVAISNYAGCIQSGNIFWWTDDIDVIFNNIPYTGYKWEYGPGTPSGSQIDFESVALHEMGHGHQLGHVINSNTVMHYSIGPGQRKNVINSNDSFGALNVMGKISSVCGNTAMSPVSTSSCSLVSLPADWLDIVASRKTAAVKVTWKVYSEFNVMTYIVERSDDGYNFSRAGIVRAITPQGTNSGEQVLTYQFDDILAGSPENALYYRVSSMDYDGRVQTSAIVFVPAGSDNIFIVKREGENSVRIHSNQLMDDLWDLRIFNNLGQEMDYKVDNSDIILNEIPQGVYYLCYSGEGVVKTSKVLIGF